MEQLVEAGLAADSGETRKEVAEKLSGFRLIELVAALGPALTGGEQQRQAATQLLAAVVSVADPLPVRDGEILLQFMLSRLDDPTSIQPALKALQSLVAKHRQPATEVLKKVHSILEPEMRNLKQQERYSVFDLLRTLQRHTPASEFVPLFTDLASGEKDPENLMISLAISRAVLKSTSALSEEEALDLYDVTFCYFPVTFTPPRDVAVPITGDQIREDLRKTLASPKLAKLVVPALVEKLTAVSVNVKVDALVTLRCVLESCSPTEMESVWEKVWEGVRFEVLHGTPGNETFEPALNALKQLQQVPELVEAVKSEIERCKAKFSLQLAYLVVSLDKLWTEIVPMSLESALNPEGSAASSEILKVFVDAAISTKNVLPLADRVLHALLVDRSVDGLKQMAILDADYAPLVVQALVAEIPSETALTALAEVARVRSDTVQTYALPELLADMPSSLKSLATICTTRGLVSALFVRLLGRIKTADSDDTVAIFECLLKAVSNLGDSEMHGLENFIPDLLEKFTAASPSISEAAVERAAMLIEVIARGAKKMPLLPEDLPFTLFVSCIAAQQNPPRDFTLESILVGLKNECSIIRRAPYLRVAAIAANKWPSHIDLEHISTILDFSDNNKLELLMWITKGLLWRADSEGFQLATTLTSQVSRNPLVAQAFGVLIAPDRVVDRKNGVIVRPLFKQRLFNMSLPKLLNVNPNCVLALSSLIRYSPSSVVASKAADIVPVLRDSLKSPANAAPHAQEIALRALIDAVPSNLELFSTFSIDPILELAVKGRTPGVRTGAMNLLYTLRHFPDVQARRDDIIGTLQSALEDPKREVRRCASQTRQAYYL